jgi:hypothetical protein
LSLQKTTSFKFSFKSTVERMINNIQKIAIRKNDLYQKMASQCYQQTFDKMWLDRAVDKEYGKSLSVKFPVLK